MRHIFNVMIYEKQYGVFDIEGKEHEGLNGEIKTWWLYFSDQMPDGVLPPVDSEYWKPWHVSIERHVWDFRITQKNTTKEKWGNTQFRNSTLVQMICNGKLVYEFRTSGGERGISFAFAKIQYMQTMLTEHPYNFFEPAKENGRKIFWKGMPATVNPKSNGFEIAIIPDYTNIPKKTWWEILKNKEIKLGLQNQDYVEMDADQSREDQSLDYINWGDAFSDQYIDWFRK